MSRGNVLPLVAAWRERRVLSLRNYTVEVAERMINEDPHRSRTHGNLLIASSVANGMNLSAASEGVPTSDTLAVAAQDAYFDALQDDSMGRIDNAYKQLDSALGAEVAADEQFGLAA